jgi:hypothetical protein
VFILTFFEKDTFSWYLPETASNLLRVAETLAGVAAGASTEQNRAKPSGTEQNRAEPSKIKHSWFCPAQNRAKLSCAVKNGGLTGAPAASSCCWEMYIAAFKFGDDLEHKSINIYQYQMSVCLPFVIVIAS